MIAAQSQANKDAIIESAKVNSVNLYGPTGSVYYEKNPDGTPKAQYTQLSPQGQWLFDAQQAIAAQLAQQAFGRVAQIPSTPFSLSGIPYNPVGYNTSAMPVFNTYSYPVNSSQADQSFQPPNGNPYQSFFPSMPVTGSGTPQQQGFAGFNMPFGGMPQPPPVQYGGASSDAGAPPSTDTSSAPQAGSSPSQGGSSLPWSLQAAQNIYNSGGGGKGGLWSGLTLGAVSGLTGQDYLNSPASAPGGGTYAGMPPPGPVQGQMPQFPGIYGAWPSSDSMTSGSASFAGGSPSVPPGQNPSGNYPNMNYPTQSLNVLPYDPRSYGDINIYNNQAGQAAFNQQMGLLAPQHAQQWDRMLQTLQDRGLPVGSEAFNSAIGEMMRGQNWAVQQAANQAMQVAGQEAQRKMQMEQGLRGTSWQEALTGHQQALSDQMQRLQTEQQLRNQILQEMLMERNQGFNEASAFLQGSPALGMPQAPDMPKYQIAPPDVIGATLGGYKAQMGAWDAQQDINGSMWQGATNLATSLAPIAFKSSRSLKHDDGEPTRILDAVRKLRVRTWRYLPHIDPRQEMHIGPYAEDWTMHLGLGNGREISVVDAVGVCLQCIKELADEVQKLGEIVLRKEDA